MIEARSKQLSSFSEFRGLRHGASRYLITRIVEIAKCRNAKLQHGVSGIATWSFRNSQHAKSRNAERDYCESRRLEGKNVEIPSAVRLGKEGIRL
jgi:hypothetical protein